MIKIYLTTPYSHNNSHISDIRFETINKVAAKLMSKGYLVFSPISHGHPIALAGDLPKGWDYWGECSQSFIEWCDELWVCMQGGWQVSTGVTAEIRIATDMKKPIRYIEPEIYV